MSMWAAIVGRLEGGEVVEMRPSGGSMVPIIRSRQLVRLEPVGEGPVEVGMVVLAKVHGRYYLHKVVGVRGERVQIGNNRGFVNGWTARDRVYGVATAVDGRPI